VSSVKAEDAKQSEEPNQQNVMMLMKEKRRERST